MAVTFNNLVNVPYIFRYKASTSTYSSNESGKAVFDYFYDDAQVGDCLYFGMTASQGYPSTIKINIGVPLVAGSINLVWEYYTGSPTYNPANWRAIPSDRLQDTSNGFTRIGVQYIGFRFNPPIDYNWSYTNGINGVGYQLWIRCRIVAVTNVTEGGANQTTAAQYYDMKSRITGTSSFDDLVTVDKLGTFTLMWPIPASNDLSLLWQPRPQEWGATKLKLVITGYSSGGNVTLSGKDENNAPITETVPITGNGTYNTTKAFKNIDTGGIDCIGNYTIEIQQPRWGAFGKFGNMWQISHTQLGIGDGSIQTNISASKGMLRLVYSGISQLANSNLILGTKEASYNYPIQPFFISVENTSGQNADYGWLNPLINLMDIGLYNVIYCLEGGPNSRFQLNSADTEIRRFTAPSGSLYYLYLVGNAGLGQYSDLYINILCSSLSTKPLYYDFGIYGGVYYGGFLIGGPAGDTPDTATRIIRPKFANNDRDVVLSGGGRGAVVIDPLEPLVTSKLGGNMTSGQIYRIWLYYTFKVKVTDKVGKAIGGALVKVVNKNDVQQFSEITDIDGQIIEKEILVKLWEKVGQGVGYVSFSDTDMANYNDFTITISKPGYEMYRKKFTLNFKTNWIISLRHSSSVGKDAMGYVWC